MKRLACLLLAMALSTSLLCHIEAKPVPKLPEKKDVKSDLEAIQGEWTMISLEQMGKKADESMTQYTLTIKGEQWMVKSPKTNLDGKASVSIKIDSTKNPKTIDMTTKIGDNELSTISPGIYKLEGDVLTLCRTAGKGDRPTEFKGDDAILVVWKRVAK